MLVFNKKFKVGAYIRLSREDGDKQESESIGNQRKIIERYLKECGLSYTAEYVDDGWSGTTFNRPAFMSLIEDIKSKKIDMVITKDLSRLGRDYIQTGYYIENFFPENHIRYVSILDGIDTFIDSTNNDITPFKAILNDMYAKDISKKVKSVLREKQKNGEFMCSTPPYGYKRHPTIKNKLIIDNNVAYVVRKIFDMYDNGVGSILIKKYLDENHYNPPRVYRQTGLVQDENGVKTWHEVAIMNILQNEVYIGNMIQNKRPVISYKVKKTRKTDKSEQIRVNNTHEPIIDKDLFERIQPVIETRRRNSEFKYDYLLRDFLRCKHCGRKLQIVLKKNSARPGPKRPYITCMDHKPRGCYALNMNYNKFEEKVLEVIKKVCEIYHNEKVFYSLYHELDSNNLNIKSKYEKNVQSLEYDVRDINFKLDKMYNDRLNGVITDEDYKRYSDNFVRERERLRQEIAEIELKLKELEQNTRYSETEDKELKDVIKDFLSLKEIKKINLYRLIKKIEIDKDKNVYIYFNFSKLNIISQNIDDFIEVSQILNQNKKKKAM